MRSFGLRNEVDSGMARSIGDSWVEVSLGREATSGMALERWRFLVTLDTCRHPVRVRFDYYRCPPPFCLSESAREAGERS